MLQLIPFIMFEGQAKDAISFYEKALDAKVVFKRTMGELPTASENPLTEEQKDRIVHSVLKIGETSIFVSDWINGQVLQKGNQVMICLTTRDADKARQYFEALQPGGKILIPLGEVPFSPAYGMLKDKFGVTFQVFTATQQTETLYGL